MGFPRVFSCLRSYVYHAHGAPDADTQREEEEKEDTGARENIYTREKLRWRDIKRKSEKQREEGCKCQ